ncbi:MAG TPA: hypothetical protein PK579_00780 [Phycisphaerae bacterium]|nr:hypothetical protein [Phycisphaerae bacterium]
MTMRPFAILLTVGCLVMVSTAGCRRGESPRAETGAAKSAFAVCKRFGSGPVQFTIELSKAEMTTADSVTCRMTLDVAKGYEAEFPDIALPEDVPGAIVTGFDESETTKGDRRIMCREYELEAEYEGTLRLPKMEVYSHRAGEVKEDVIETDPIEVTVKSTRETAGDLELRPMRGLVTVEQMRAQERRVWPWVAGGVVGIAGLVALAVWLIRRPRPAPPPPPAHETALRRLGELAGKGLITAGASEAFFVEVTGIVRDYIEQAFGVRAPEQTTEEFLASMMAAPAVAAHRAVLEPFLVAADEVKFACVRADMEAMQRAFDTAEEFVLRTAGVGAGQTDGRRAEDPSPREGGRS